MIENRKLLAAVTVLALVGVLGLFAYSATLEPLELDIAEIGEEHTGSVVCTSGTLTKARTVSGGAVSLTLCDLAAGASIGVFYTPDGGEPLSGGIVPGAIVGVRGEVRLYQEKPEIYVTRAADIVLLSDANSTEYGLGTVMESIQLLDGMNLTTSGRMADIEVIRSGGSLVGTAFSLVAESDNTTYTLACFCPGRDLGEAFGEWEPVRASGRISYYTAGGCWQMEVEVVSAPGPAG